MSCKFDEAAHEPSAVASADLVSAVALGPTHMKDLPRSGGHDQRRRYRGVLAAHLSGLPCENGKVVPLEGVDFAARAQLASVRSFCGLCQHRRLPTRQRPSTFSKSARTVAVMNFKVLGIIRAGPLQRHQHRRPKFMKQHRHC